jgi:hypothetical protein
MRLLSFTAWFYNVQLGSHLVTSSQPSSANEVPDMRISVSWDRRTEFQTAPNSQNWVCIVLDEIFARFHCQLLKRVPNAIVLTGWRKVISFRITALFSSFPLDDGLKGSITSVQQTHIFVESFDDEDSSAIPQTGM